MNKQTLIILTAGLITVACLTGCMRTPAVTADETATGSEDAAKNIQRNGINDQRNKENQERNARAGEALENSDFITAEDLYNETLASYEFDVSAMLGLIRVYEAQNRKEEARDMLAYLMADHDGWSASINIDPYYLMKYAILCEETFRPEEANRAYREILENGGNLIGEKFPKVDPSVLPDSQIKSAAHIVTGRSTAFNDDPDQALDHFRKAAELSSDYALARYHYGNELRRRGQLELAKSELEAAKALDPTNELLAEVANKYLKEIGYALEGLRRG